LQQQVRMVSFCRGLQLAGHVQKSKKLRDLLVWVSLWPIQVFQLRKDTESEYVDRFCYWKGEKGRIEEDDIIEWFISGSPVVYIIEWFYFFQTNAETSEVCRLPYLFIYFILCIYFFIHMCIQCLGHFCPLPPAPSITPYPPTLTPWYQAETILPLSLILLKREYKQ
jgi:hypothetical protein